MSREVFWKGFKKFFIHIFFIPISFKTFIFAFHCHVKGALLCLAEVIGKKLIIETTNKLL